MSSTTAYVQLVRKEVKEAEQRGFVSSLKGLPPAEKQSKRRARRLALKVRREKRLSEQRAFFDSLIGLSPMERQLKKQERRKKILEECEYALLALEGGLKHSSDDDKELQRSGYRALVHQRTSKRRADFRAFRASIKEPNEGGDVAAIQKKVDDPKGAVTVISSSARHRAVRLARRQRKEFGYRFAPEHAAIVKGFASISLEQTADNKLVNETSNRSGRNLEIPTAVQNAAHAIIGST